MQGYKFAWRRDFRTRSDPLMVIPVVKRIGIISLSLNCLSKCISLQGFVDMIPINAPLNKSLLTEELNS